MTHLLDSDICIALLRHRESPVARKLAQLPPADVALCSIVIAELSYGARHSDDPEKHLVKLREFTAQFASLPFDDAAADLYGTIRAGLAAQGRPIGPNDMLIAAIALARNLTLVTHNTDEFRRVPGLKVEDWLAV